MKRPRIGHAQRCDCKDDPLPSGRHYLGWEMCDACGLFIVRNWYVIRELLREQAQAEAEAMQRESPWKSHGEDAA